MTYLSNEDNDYEDEAQPRAINATSSTEGDLIESVAIVSPGRAEADVCHAYTTPCEEGGQTRQRHQQVEDDLAALVEVDICQQAADDDGDGGPEWTAGPVHVGEDLGGVALLSKGGQSAGSAVDAREADGDDRNKDDHIDEAVEAFQAGVICCNDKWARSNVDFDFDCC